MCWERGKGGGDVKGGKRSAGGISVAGGSYVSACGWVLERGDDPQEPLRDAGGATGGGGRGFPWGLGNEPRTLDIFVSGPLTADFHELKMKRGSGNSSISTRGF